MSNEPEVTPRNLVPWQIRDVPRDIRDAVVEQARVEGVKVPELLTRLVEDARSVGWSMKASNLFANASDGPADRFANTSDRARLKDAFAMLEQAAGAGVPIQKGVAAIANRLLKQELTAIEGPRKTKPRALPSPSPRMMPPPLRHLK